jgi:GDP-4-dehydro-6-deoxy-D-mannose reductase
MRFFVTGISGFVGTHLTNHLLERGHSVCGLAREPGEIGDLARRYGDRFPLSAVTLCDVRDRERVRSALRAATPDGIFHLAALAFVPQSFERPDLAYQVNFLGAVEVLSAAREVAPRARVVLVTSGEIYGAIDPAWELPLVETQPLRPLSPYSVAKAAADLSGFQFFASHGLDVVRARPFNHTGPGQSPQFVCSEFARMVAAAEIGSGPRRLRVGNLAAERDFSDVRDVVRGYLSLFEGGVSGEAYNIASGEATQIESILDELRALSSVSVQVETDPRKLRPREISRVFASITKVREATGWEPRIPLRQTLADLLEDWRARLRGRGA